MAKCIRVPKSDGEPYRRGLIEEGLLDLDYRIGSDGGDLLIIGLTGVLLLCRAAVDGQEGRSFLLGDPGDRSGVFMLLIPSQPHLDGYRQG